jgi:hypothetical protein
MRYCLESEGRQLCSKPVPHAPIAPGVRYAVSGQCVTVWKVKAGKLCSSTRLPAHDHLDVAIWLATASAARGI